MLSYFCKMRLNCYRSMTVLVVRKCHCSSISKHVWTSILYNQKGNIDLTKFIKLAHRIFFINDRYTKTSQLSM